MWEHISHPGPGAMEWRGLSRSLHALFGLNILTGNGPENKSVAADKQPLRGPWCTPTSSAPRNGRIQTEEQETHLNYKMKVKIKDVLREM